MFDKSVGPKSCRLKSRVQKNAEYLPPLQFYAKILEVKNGGVTIYRKEAQPVSQVLATFISYLREFLRDKSYCKLRGAQG
ncbi:hypothetical protein TNCV_2907101 [Trichonephila clavipes]|nr:hypothetical protein TNCV_2907101 [Trichonephila clavipes]